jgi:hypothetical protein
MYKFYVIAFCSAVWHSKDVAASKCIGLIWEILGTTRVLKDTPSDMEQAGVSSNSMAAIGYLALI